MPDNSLYLVSCGFRKASAPTQAQDLYVSPWFIKARRYVEAMSAPWRILSAKFGVVEPTQVIEPYDTTLNSMPVAARRRWAAAAAAAIGELVGCGGRVVVLAGTKYREHLVPLLESTGIMVEVPMAGLGIGQQLSWLNSELEIIEGRARIAK